MHNVIVLRLGLIVVTQSNCDTVVTMTNVLDYV